VLRLSLVAGLAAAVVYTVAPLSVWVIAIGAGVFARGRRALPIGDRRVLDLLLVAAIAARLLFIVAVFLKNVPQHHDMWLGELTGDGAYGLSRGLRARDLLLGVPTSRFDAFVVNDIYGRNYYVGLLTGLQVLFGPIPYSVRVMNGFFYLAGALLLFRLTRRVYGRLPAFAALTVVLFLPSFFVWSVSLLKEPLYFLCTAIFLTAASRSLRGGPSRARILAAACAVAALVVMEGVRHKTFAIGLLGWAIAAGMIVVFSRPRRYLPVAAVGVAAILALLARPAVQNRALDTLAESAKIHAGHVFTLGHGYKLLDESFYYRVQDPNSSTLTLTADQAAKFWPAYSKFQAEQATIVDAQLAAMQKYVTSFGSIDDAKALEYTNANLARDQQMFELRSKWLKEFQKILPARIAARVIQIDRRLGIAHQLFLSSQLPLIY